jgi:hypothetical protein
VQALPAGAAGRQLGAAGEPVGQDRGFLVGRPRRGPQAPVRAGSRDLVVPALEAEVPGQAAASGIEDVDVHADAAQDLLIGVEAHDGVLMAVHLRDGPLTPGAALPVPAQALEQVAGLPARLEQQLSQGPGLLGQQPGFVVTEEFGRVGAEHRSATRLEDHDGDPGPQVGQQRLDGAAQHPLGHAELAGGDPGQPAAQQRGAPGGSSAPKGGPGGWVPPGGKQPTLLERHVDGEASPLEHGHRGLGDLGVEVVAERIGPQDHAPTGGGRGSLAASEPRGEAPPGEAWKVSAGVDATGPFGQRGNTRSTAGQVHDSGQAGHGGHQPGDHRQPAHRVVRGGPDPARVVVGKELRLVGGHVHADRAFLAAALAGQAQVQGVADLGRMPAAGDHVASYHLHEQPGAAPGGVLLLPGHPVARAHDAAFVAAAFADADAARGGAGAELPAVVRVFEERPRLAREPTA